MAVSFHNWIWLGATKNLAFSTNIDIEIQKKSFEFGINTLNVKEDNLVFIPEIVQCLSPNFGAVDGVKEPSMLSNGSKDFSIVFCRLIDFFIVLLLEAKSLAIHKN